MGTFTFNRLLIMNGWFIVIGILVGWYLFDKVRDKSDRNGDDKGGGPQMFI